jgi:hypothetical protein
MILASHIGAEWLVSPGIMLLASIIFLLILFIGAKITNRHFMKIYAYDGTEQQIHPRRSISHKSVK